MGFAKNATHVAVNKAAPWMSVAHDILTNSDFYGTEIYHPGDSSWKQTADIGERVAKSFEPIGITSGIERMSRESTPGQKAKVLANSLLGFTLAPVSLSDTKAQALTHELAEREWKVGPHTQASFDHHKLFSLLQRRQAAGEDISKDYAAGLKSGILSIDDGEKLLDESKAPLNNFQREFKLLKLPDMFAVMKQATPEERTQVKEILDEAFVSAVESGSMPEVDLQQYQKELDNYSK